MKRLPAALAAVVLVSLGALTGCSGGDGSDYCNRVRDNAESDTLGSIDLTSADGMKAFIAAAKKLQADAPEEVKDDYDALVKAFEDPQNLDPAEVTSSIDTIEKYDEDNCDVTYEN